MICLPALTVAYCGLAAVWNWPYADEVAKTSAVICTLLGALLGISTAEYNKDVEVQPLLECDNEENAKLIIDILAADQNGEVYRN